MRLATNTFYSLAQRGLGRFASAVTLILLARTQGPELVGLFSLALTFHVLMTGWWVGIDDKMVREIARGRGAGAENAASRQFTWRVILGYLGLRTVVSLVILLAVASLIYWGNWYSPAETWFILLMLTSTVTDNATLALVTGYVGNERFAPVFAVMALQTGLRLGFIVAVLSLQVNISAIAATWLVTSLLTTAVALGLFIAHFWVRGARVWPAGLAWSSIIAPKQDWSFLVMGIVVMLEYQVDIILLSLFRSAGEVGYYSTATTLFALATLPVQAFRSALYPTMSRIAFAWRAADVPAAQVRPELQNLYDWSLASVLSVALLSALLGVFFAEPVIALVFGPAMTPAALPTQILMLAVIVFSLNVPHSRLLLATNRQTKAAQFITASAVINIVANLWLGSWLGAPGTAAARGISTSVFLLLAAWSVRSLVRLPGWRAVLPPLIATAVTGGFLLVAASWPWWWFAAAAGLLLYAALWWSVAGMTGARAAWQETVSEKA